MHPMPYSASERAAGLATGPQLRYLAGNEDLLPMVLDDGRELLPAVQDTPVIRIGGTAPAPGPATIETRTARREPTKESDLIVPLGQALVTACMVALSAGVLSWAAGWSWKVAAVAFAGALVLSWFWRLRLVDSLLWTVETMTGRDLTGDGVTGKPHAQVAFTAVNPGQARAAVAAENRQEQQSAERAALLAFVDKCFMAGTSEAAHGIKASGSDRAAFVAHRDTLLTLGVAKWRNPEKPKAGWELACNHQRARQIITKHVL